MSKHFFQAIATLVGTIIGAGVLAIPYVVAKAGLLTGIFMILVLGASLLFINLYVGEIVLRTKGTHQLTGYVEKYLGQKAKFLMIFSLVFGIYGALLAYFLGVGTSLHELFGTFSPFTYSVIFLTVMAVFIYYDLKAIEKSELFLSFSMMVVILLITFLGLPHTKVENFSGFSLTQMFLPYGVIFFAFLGTAAIPEMKEELIKNTKALKKAIIVGSLIPLFIYLFFTIVVVLVTGLQTEQIGTIGLAHLIGKKMFLLGNLFPILSMSTSFLILGLALKWMYHYDLKVEKKTAWFVTLLVPLLLAFLGVSNFIGVINTVGAITGGIDGILIVLMYHRAKKLGKREPEYSLKERKWLSYFLGTLFLIGMFSIFF